MIISFLLFFLYYLFFILSYNFINLYIPSDETPSKIYSYLLLSTILGLYYYYIIFKRKSPLTNWKFGTIFVILTALSTPVVLETDIYRYVWDGLNTSLGINPFRYAPRTHPLLENYFWSGLINHPDLPSVYPPGAQFFFFISTYLNPFFYQGFHKITEIWQIVFGWKLLIGLSSACSIFVLRKKRWDLIASHPAFLILSLGNAHLDSLLIPLVLIILSTKYYRVHERFQNLAMTFGVLTKWIPILFFPSLIIFWAKRWGKKTALSASLLSLLLMTLALILFYKGSEGGLFYSTIIYGENWYFFGYIHRFIADFLNLFSIKDTFYYSKIICFFLGLTFSAFLFVNFLKNRLSLSLFCLWIILGLLVFSPTLHPWYLLILLPLGMSYKGVFLTPFIWPLLGLYSKFYFLNKEDPTLLRYIIYFLITIFILKDYSKLRTRWKKNYEKISISFDK